MSRLDTFIEEGMFMEESRRDEIIRFVSQRVAYARFGVAYEPTKLTITIFYVFQLLELNECPV